ncbi:MAG: hypothetical protein ACR2JB_07375 [Bryobacteraceae bacterium]
MTEHLQLGEQPQVQALKSVLDNQAVSVFLGDAATGAHDRLGAATK